MAPENRVLAVLGYHKVGPLPPGGWDSWYYIPEATFVAQLGHLRDHGWEVIGVERLLDALSAPESLPQRAALITFDDGYRSNRHVALPLLQRFGYPAVLFMPTDYIGGTNAFDADVEPEEAMCDWEDLRALEDAGVSIQSHGVSHRAFSSLSPAELERELGRSKAALEEGLGKPVEVFSFPYGDNGSDPAETDRALARAGYRAACLYGGGPSPVPVPAPFRLTRVAMGPDTDLSAALALAQGGPG